MHVIDKPVTRTVIWTIKTPTRMKNGSRFLDLLSFYADEYGYQAEEWNTLDKGPDGNEAYSISILGFDQSHWCTFFYCMKSHQIFVKTIIRARYETDINDVLYSCYPLLDNLNLFCNEIFGHKPKLLSWDHTNKDEGPELTFYPGKAQHWMLNIPSDTPNLYSIIVSIEDFKDFPVFMNRDNFYITETGIYFVIYFNELNINEMEFLISKRSNTIIIQTFFDYSGLPDNYGNGDNEYRYEDISDKFKTFCKQVFEAEPVLIGG